MSLGLCYLKSTSKIWKSTQGKFLEASVFHIFRHTPSLHKKSSVPVIDHSSLPLSSKTLSWRKRKIKEKMNSGEPWDVENGLFNGPNDEPRLVKTAHNLSCSSLRNKSNPALIVNSGSLFLRNVLVNLREVILGTKIWPLFFAIPMAVVAQIYDFGGHWLFALSMLGLAPLAERISFLTEQIAYYTGPTVGGLLNATCGNATELIIAILALYQGKISVLKYSLLGSILSNLLLVLGSSLLCGGLANLSKDQKFDKSQTDVNILLMLLGVLCHALPFFSRNPTEDEGSLSSSRSILMLSRVSSIVMLVAYIAYLVFQLKTHQQHFDSPEEETGENDEEDDETAVIGFWNAMGWLIGMTALTALLSEFVVATIEDASSSWGISIRFLSIILLPIVGNAAEHAGAIIFAYKNKLDISLGVALGSATQISIFLVPLCIIVAWIMHIDMDLSLSALETSSFALSVLSVAFALQDGSSHYLKGAILLLGYVVISACFFVHNDSPIDVANLMGSRPTVGVGYAEA